jgi:hypothetical protein
MVRKLLLPSIVALVLLASPVMAKEGFYAGLFLPTMSSNGTGSVQGADIGWGLRVGNGFNRYFSVEGSKSANTNLSGYAVDLKISFPLSAGDGGRSVSWEPYLLGGYDYFEMRKAPKQNGSGIQYGFGVDFYFSREFKELSLNAGWTKSAASFGKEKSAPKFDGTITTLDFGVAYHFI